MMMRYRVAGAGLLLAMLGAPTLRAQDCAAFGVNGQLPVLDDPALASRATLLCNAGYASLNSGLVHEPLWSAERLTAEAVEGAEHTGRVTHRFHEDRRVPPEDRAVLEDYRGTGYDRGHLTPSGDEIDARVQGQTYSLANVVPQTPELNEGIWTGVEMAVRDLALRDGVVYVVTGPSFHGELRTIGVNHVRVPSATWKAVYDPAGDRTGVYVCKNTESPSCTTVTVAVLIDEVGIDPFPGLPAAVKARTPNLPAPEESPYTPRTRDDRSDGWNEMPAPLSREVEKDGRGALRALMRDLASGHE